MSVRQYIGARYVTKIYENSLDPSSAEWEAGINYEPLVLVTYNYGSYLSKKAVPANIGNPADNPIYWVQTGFYNGQIAGLQAQIDTINSIMAVDHPTLKDRKFILLGDSYGEGWDPDGTNDGWCKLFKNMMSLDADHCAYSGYGGSKFSAGGTMTFEEQLTDHISVDDPLAITDIIVAGGFNDQVNTSGEINAGITSFVATARTMFPKASIHVAFVGWTTDALNGSGGTYTEALCIDAYKAYEKGCFINGIHFMPDVIHWCVAQNFSTDYKHPTQNGNLLIAENLILGLNDSGSEDIREALTPAIWAPDTGIAYTAGSSYPELKIVGNAVNIRQGYAHINVSPARTVSMDGTTGIKLFDLYSPLLKPSDITIIPTAAFIHTTSGYVNLNTACIKITGNSWYFIAPQVTSGAFESRTIDQIHICGFNTFVPFFNHSEMNSYPITV